MLCGGGRRRPAGRSGPGAGPGRVQCGRAGDDSGGRLHPAASAAGRGADAAGRIAAGRKARYAGAGRDAVGRGESHRRRGRGRAGRLLRPGRADHPQRHPHGGRVHRHPDERAQPHPLGQQHPADRLRAGGAGAGRPAGGAGSAGDGGGPPPGPEGAGRELRAAERPHRPARADSAGL